MNIIMEQVVNKLSVKKLLKFVMLVIIGIQYKKVA
jgi:hypothetical protein